MTEYRIEITVAATCYIKASSEAEALETFNELQGDLTHGREDFELEPGIKLSPAMTLIGAVTLNDVETV